MGNKKIVDHGFIFIYLMYKSNKQRNIFFKKTGLFQFTNFLERSIKHWHISRTGYQS